MLHAAEHLMRQDKQKYYQKNGKTRQIRTLNQELEQMLLKKQDADAFLSVLAPEFKGVYFVNLNNDTIRHLYIPSYFEEILEETGDIFSKALSIYARRHIAFEYRRPFENFCDFKHVQKSLQDENVLEFMYQRTDGLWLKLRILKFKAQTPQVWETLWIFSTIDRKA